MPDTSAFTITPRGPFALQEAVSFLGGWTPGGSTASDSAEHLHLAFVVDGTDRAAGVCLHEEPGRVVGAVFQFPDPEPVRRQVARVLSLDTDATPFAEIGARDPVVGRLLAQRPGFRPVNFLSPYEAAVWFVLSQRLRMSQAAALKRRLAEQLGEPVGIHGDVRHAFPPPSALVRLESFPGIPERKLANLRAVAAAAEAGRLDADHLRGQQPEAALAGLQQIAGIGPFSSEGVLLRGAGIPDYLSLREPRLRQAVGLAYGLGGAPSDEQLAAIADGWRPFRTWVGVLFRSASEPEDQNRMASQTAMARAMSSSRGTRAKRK